MKKFITTLTSIFIAAIVMAQAPDVMNYQAVARNNAGQALANQTIKVRLSITKNAVSLYSETRQVTTNALGLFNVQIGSSGPISTTGNFSTINWQNNPTTHYLKVELDINNTGLFTDMGSQALVSVPYAFHSKTADDATEVKNIAGRPIDQTAIPTVGARLSWNGTNWAPVKKDTVITVASAGRTVVSGGSNAPWEFSYPTINTITVTGGERIIANIGVSLGHAHTTSNALVSYSICYQSTVPGSPIVEFNPGIYPDGGVPVASQGLSQFGFFSSGAITLPPGQYRIGLGIKNKSNIVNLSNNGAATGTIEIKY